MPYSVLQQEMEHAARLEVVSTLARGIAHDFNHIVGIAKNYLSFVEEKCPAEAASDISVIRDALAQGEALSRSLMRFSQAEAPHPIIFSLNDAIERVEPLIESLGLTLDYDLADDLAPVKADQGQVEQVIFNLAQNARDAMGREDQRLCISTYNEICTVEDPESLEVGEIYVHDPSCDNLIGVFVTLKIKDTGCGIAPDVLKRVFDPYFSTKNTQGANRGLGLATVYGVVARAGGQIRVNSTLGEGTTFTIRLPAGVVSP